jgi:hypothetical protein
MKTYEIMLQQVVSYRLTVKARSAGAAEQAALDAFGQSDDGFKEVYSAVEVLDVTKAAP